VSDLLYSPRRGGHDDAIRRRTNLLSSVTAGQALAAFHQCTAIAYHQKTDLWERDDLYAKFFNEKTTGEHVVFAYSLLKTVETWKLYLIDQATKSAIGEDENTQLSFYRIRGSILLAVSAVSSVLETILNKSIPNKFMLCFRSKTTIAQGLDNWRPIVQACTPFVHVLSEAVADLRAEDKIENAIKTFRSLVVATKTANASVYRGFRDLVT
jgi:hypothetical protein